MMFEIILMKVSIYFNRTFGIMMKNNVSIHYINPFSIALHLEQNFARTMIDSLMGARSVQTGASG